jgi:hypothetical protein
VRCRKISLSSVRWPPSPRQRCDWAFCSPQTPLRIVLGPGGWIVDVAHWLWASGTIQYRMYLVEWPKQNTISYII